MNGRVNSQNTKQDTGPLFLQMEIFLRQVSVEIKSLFRLGSLVTEKSGMVRRAVAALQHRANTCVFASGRGHAEGN